MTQRNATNKLRSVAESISDATVVTGARRSVWKERHVGRSVWPTSRNSQWGVRVVVMPSGELHALLKDLAFIVMLSKSFRKSVQLAEASILISNAEPHLLPVLEASILISNAESHVKDFSHGYYQALLPLSYSITSCLYKEAKRPLTFVYTLSVNSIVKLAYSSCLKPSSLLCFPKLSTQSNYLLPCPAKPLQASNCFQTRPRPYSPVHSFCFST